MRVKTLKADADRLGGLLAYYAGLAEDRERPGRRARGPVDYYLDPDEPAGRWWGSGCAGLGLAGEVKGGQLWALLDARHPTTGTKLGRGFGASSARGFDATFSAPKSVSALWALSPDASVRAEVLAAQDAAVDAALAWFERHGAVTRRGTDGIHQVDSRGVTVALFRQHTSRTMDPQVHTHAIVSAKVQDATGTWLSLDARFLKGQQRTLSWIYDAALRAELTARLGVAWEPIKPGEGQSDLVVVPERLRDLFSERSRQVEAKLAELLRRWIDEHDGDEPSPRTIASLERTAVRTSRPAKTHGVDGDALRREWIDTARAAGFDPSRLVPPSPMPLPGIASIDRDAIVRAALDGVEAEKAAWLPADISRHIAPLLPAECATDAPRLTALVDELTDIAVERCLPLGPEPSADSHRRRDGRPISEAVTDRRMTTRTVWDQEQALIEWAHASISATPTTTDPQLAAVQAVTGDAALALVVGPAGTGKTTALGRAVRHLDEQGRPVIGLAPSGKAADVLAAETGCPAVTLAKLLADLRTQDSPAGTTVILDEAGMCSTDDLDRLVRLVDARRWRLVCVGDPEQLPSVGRGGMFAHWCETLPTIDLIEVHRYDEDWQAEASLALRRGDPAAVRAYADRGRVRGVHPALLPDEVARIHRRLDQRGESVAITTASAGMARAINTAIQSRELRRTGVGVALADGTQAHVGDRIATRRNDASLRSTRGHEVRNRQTWTVAEAHADGGLTVHDPERGSVVLPANYVSAHVELGWAVTGYGNQGTTTDHAIAVIEPSSTRAGTYVAMTRGRKRNIALVVDPTGLASPDEILEQVIARPANTSTAHATLERLGGSAPEPPPPSPEMTEVDRIRQRLDRLQERPAGRGIGIS